MCRPAILPLLLMVWTIAAGGLARGAEAGPPTPGLRAGAASRVITPDPLLPVSGGMGPAHPATEKRGELTARAFVLADADTTVAIVGLDTLGFPGVLADRVRALVPRLPAQHILIAATHTHSAPDCYAFPDGTGGHTGNLEWMDDVVRKTAEAVNEALDAFCPATLHVATAEAKGRIAFNYYAPDLYDRRMGVIQAIALDGKPIATLVNYAIHPEVIGNQRGILSPDLIGPMCTRIEERGGGLAVFINGAQGGMITADNRDLEAPTDPVRGYWKDIGTWEECERIGHTMADEALRIVADAEADTSPAVAAYFREVRFPVDSDDLWAVVSLSPLGYPHDDATRTITARLAMVDVGKARILTIPGEALPNIGAYLKRKAGDDTFLFGLTNDAFGYILTKEDFLAFPRYQYVSRVSLGERTGTILVDNLLEMVGETPRPGAK
ncbi:MAG: hypothetical protein DWH87_03810 [Planctomycetota bacterium]|nr:MAG: hypothetical protein DWH87_03810 [Planctomycetota bacterium]